MKIHKIAGWMEFVGYFSKCSNGFETYIGTIFIDPEKNGSYIWKNVTCKKCLNTRK